MEDFCKPLCKLASEGCEQVCTRMCEVMGHDGVQADGPELAHLADCAKALDPFRVVHASMLKISEFMADMIDVTGKQMPSNIKQVTCQLTAGKCCEEVALAAVGLLNFLQDGKLNSVGTRMGQASTLVATAHQSMIALKNAAGVEDKACNRIFLVIVVVFVICSHVFVDDLAKARG